MELRHLRYFVGVAEALSFTKAAEKLHTAQPSLSRQIKDLEEELGVRLLNRTKVLQDVDLERTMIHAISAGLGVALVPEQLKKLPHKNVVFRPVKPAVATEACVAWKGEDPSAPLKAYVEIVEHVGRSIR